jgi:hypothetical protein
VGGGFGLAALPVELPISTIIMLRSIGDIARSEGEDPEVDCCKLVTDLSRPGFNLIQTMSHMAPTI